MKIYPNDKWLKKEDKKQWEENRRNIIKGMRRAKGVWAKDEPTIEDLK